MAADHRFSMLKLFVDPIRRSASRWTPGSLELALTGDAGTGDFASDLPGATSIDQQYFFDPASAPRREVDSDEHLVTGWGRAEPSPVGRDEVDEESGVGPSIAQTTTRSQDKGVLVEE